MRKSGKKKHEHEWEYLGRLTTTEEYEQCKICKIARKIGGEKRDRVILTDEFHTPEWKIEYPENSNIIVTKLTKKEKKIHHWGLI